MSATPYTGTRLFDWAAERGITRAELCRRMHYSWIYLWRIRNGSRPITRRFVLEAVRVTGLAESDLFFGPEQGSDLTYSGSAMAGDAA